MELTVYITKQGWVSMMTAVTEWPNALMASTELLFSLSALASDNAGVWSRSALAI